MNYPTHKHKIINLTKGQLHHREETLHGQLSLEWSLPHKTQLPHDYEELDAWGSDPQNIPEFCGQNSQQDSPLQL